MLKLVLLIPNLLASLIYCKIQASYIAILNMEYSTEAAIEKLSAIANVQELIGLPFNTLYITLNSSNDMKLLENQAYINHIEPDSELIQHDVYYYEEKPAPWHLDRIEGNKDTGSFKFAHTGNGVKVYILDTPIQQNHQEYQGRMSEEANFAASSSLVIGPAKDAIGISVPIAGCKREEKATVKTLLQGISWAFEDAISNGIVVVTSAGNENDDACLYSGNKVPGVITVAASTKSNGRASFSNWGPCVTVFAPGSQLLAAKFDISEYNKYMYVHGTSASAALVAGVAACLLQADNNLNSFQIKEEIILAAKTDLISETGLYGTTKRLINITPNVKGVKQTNYDYNGLDVPSIVNTNIQTSPNFNFNEKGDDPRLNRPLINWFRWFTIEIELESGMH
ncbi:subtilisin-like protein [Rozella allomycis CSF55]|uniref:Subtilisin-like protein n=1 Tax=Rozella allomycis (strain CSF55) TaxID=988480 RepID=A0A4P9YHC5_ROZAC|nr:subtilisin-like protein [Rozella allomycis CSF55]